jgi:ring-1,2-phenylacetyl-CoA epoxidase subunit PaaD
MGGLGRDEVMDALRRVEDPEVPVDIVALGLVQDVAVEGTRVRVTLAPTYASCPGRTLITEQARARLEEIAEDVEVRWSAAPHWRTGLIRPGAIRRMKEFGVGLPEGPDRAVACPFCGSARTRREGEFGSAVCKSLYYCDACRQPFETLRGAW